MPWELEWRGHAHSSSGECENCGAQWISISVLECLHRENDNLSSINSHLKSCSESQTVSMTALKNLLFLGAGGLT